MSLEDLTVDELRARAREMEPAHNLVQTLSKDPEARTLFQRLLKKRNPTLAIPEIDSEDRMMKVIEEERGERKKLEDKIREDTARANVEKERSRVQAKYKLSDDDMKGVEKLMIKADDNPEPIPYYDAAARVFSAARVASVPTPALLSPPVFSMPEKEVWGKGIGNRAELDRIAMREAFAAFNDIKSGKVVQ